MPPFGQCFRRFHRDPHVPDPSAAFIAADGGTSGIIVDNVADVTTYGQASSIYFTPLGDIDTPGNCTYVGCAVKVTQNGLQ
jgi:hypothetical protein